MSLSRVLATSSGEVWQTVRRSRRAKRLDAIRAAVEAVGALAQATAQATAMVLRRPAPTPRGQRPG